MSKTFKHSGKLGDLIYGLPTIRALGGGMLYLRPDQDVGFSIEAASSIMPLLEVAPYLDGVEIWNGVKVDYDLDEFRQVASPFLNIAKCHLNAFGCDETTLNKPWLPADLSWNGPNYEVLFARSLGRTSIEGFWRRAYETFGSMAAFIGTSEEHAIFEQELGPIPHLKTVDLRELAAAICNCSALIANQSCPYAIAEAIKKNSILEVDIACPNCIFDRGDVFHVRSESDVWQFDPACKQFGIGKKAGPSWSFVPDAQLEAILAREGTKLKNWERLAMTLLSRRPVQITVQNSRHWTRLLSDSPREQVFDSSDSLTLVGNPEEVRSLLLRQLYKITRAEASGLDQPMVVRPISEYMKSAGYSHLEADTIPQLLEVQFEAEPIAPLVIQESYGQLGKATMEGSSIVVLTYRSADTIESCLRSVFRTMREIDELIVVDNASDDETQEIVKALISGNERAKFIANEKNLGFSAGCNVGIRASHGQYIVLLNPDTEVFHGWIEKLESRFIDPHIGAVGPISDNVVAHQFVGMHVDMTGQTFQTVEDLAQFAAKVNHGRSMTTKLLIGLCILIPRRIFNEVGLLDENLFLGSEDLELSFRLRSHGHRLLVARDCFIHHIGGQSFKSKESSQVEDWLQQSSSALKSKVELAFGEAQVPTSQELWDSPIFSHMIG